MTFETLQYNRLNKNMSIRQPFAAHPCFLSLQLWKNRPSKHCLVSLLTAMMCKKCPYPNMSGKYTGNGYLIGQGQCYHGFPPLLLLTWSCSFRDILGKRLLHSTHMSKWPVTVIHNVACVQAGQKYVTNWISMKLVCVDLLCGQCSVVHIRKFKMLPSPK